MQEHHVSFGEQLRQFRVRAGLSQAALAERANVSPAAVTTLERGIRSAPYPRTLDALSEALGLSAQERAEFAAAARRPSPARREASPNYAGRRPALDQVPDSALDPRSSPASQDHPLTFGSELRRHRLRARMTQEILAERAGVSVATIGAFEEERRRRPYINTVDALVKALGLSEAEGTALRAIVPASAGVKPAGPGFPDLPTPLTALVGRDADVARAIELLQQGVRLLTLTGPGGVGKTRMALEVAGEARTLFPNGVVFVPLAPIVDATLVLPTLAHTVGLRDTGGQGLPDKLQRALRGRRLLLVLDNCEHLLSGITPVASILEGCPEVVVLATSRAPLRMRGEQEYPVSPLALPAFDRRPTLASAAESPAVRLFVARAQAASHGFGLTEANVSAVAAICGRLDGLPLALELAAPAVKLLPPHALLTRLHRALPLLTGGGRDLPARQQTMRETVAWSYHLLAPTEQAMLRHLAVFANGCTLEAAEAVAADTASPEPPVLAGLTALVDASLLVPIEGHAEPRYRLLETIREFALEQLEASGEAEGWRTRHLAYFVALAEQAESALEGPDERTQLDRLDLELDNLRAALAWARSGSESEQGLRLTCALYRFWAQRGHVAEARRWMESLVRALADNGLLPAPLQARAMGLMAMLAVHEGDYQAAAPLAEQSLARWRQLGQTGNSFEALNALAYVAGHQGDVRRQVDLFRDSLAVVRAQGYNMRTGEVLSWLGTLRQSAGDLSGATQLLEEGLLLFQKTASANGIAFAMLHLGSVAVARQDYERAQALFDQSLELYRDLSDSSDVAYTLGHLAGLAAWRGELGRAYALCGESVTLFRQLDDPRGLAAELSLLGRVAALLGDDESAAAAYTECLTFTHSAARVDVLFTVEGLAEVSARLAMRRASTAETLRAARLFAAAAAVRDLLGDAASQSWSIPLVPADRAAYDRQVEATRTVLGAGAFDAAWADGQRSPLEQVIAQVLASMQVGRDVVASAIDRPSAVMHQDP